MTPSSGSTKVTHSSIDGSQPPHLHSRHTLNGSAFSHASRSSIPSRSSRTPTFDPSQPAVKSNGISFTRPTSTKLLDETMSEGQPRNRPNKRKRYSEPRSGSSSQLREAQEMVEQKRAKIAARVPSAKAPGNTVPPLKQVTSLADLYTRLRRDSGVSDQVDVSNVPLTPKADSGNRQAVNRPPQSSSPGHSSASSPDPIALKEDDQEVVLVKHIRPSAARAHAHPKPMTRLINLAHLSQSLKHKASASTSKQNDVTLNGVGNKSADKPRKSMPDFAVVVTSPPRHATQKPQEPDASRPHDDSPPASTHGAATVDELSNNKMPETIILDTPTPTPTPPPPPRAQTAEVVTNSVPEQGLRRSRRGITYLNGSSLTSQDIDDLLDATPVPFDLNPRIHLAAPDGNEDNNDGSENKDKSLWWQHPTYEARAKADIQRTLRLLLPTDLANDPPPPIGEGAGRWRAEVRPRQPRARMWAERLEDAFGPGPLDRGLGRKPRQMARPAAKEVPSKRAPTMVFANTLSYGHVRRTLEPPSRRTSPSLDDTDDPLVVPDDDTTNADANESEAATWTVALLPLVKGKMTMDEAGMVRTSDTLSKVEHASEQALITLGMLKESALADTVRRLSELEDVPLGDAYGLRDRARTLAERWRETFGDGLLS
ncbi:hypothetical protein EDB85DRAFT_1935440 [Lactarius pseudohatsudake]|nr:hypothetical protein EDB85DRAFT_1935440 [Lactarius pseudohatsudake]